MKVLPPFLQLDLFDVTVMFKIKLKINYAHLSLCCYTDAYVLCKICSMFSICAKYLGPTEFW